MIFKAREKFGKQVRLTKERWNHIIDRHPEIKPHLSKIKIAIQEPEIIIENPYNKNEKYYHKYFKGLKNFLIVILETNKKFIITAFIARKRKKGKISWGKN